MFQVLFDMTPDEPNYAWCLYNASRFTPRYHCMNMVCSCDYGDWATFAIGSQFVVQSASVVTTLGVIPFWISIGLWGGSIYYPRPWDNDPDNWWEPYGLAF